MVSHFVPSVAHHLGSSPKQQADELLQRTLFADDDEMIDAPLGTSLFADTLFAPSPSAVLGRRSTPRRGHDGFDSADEDQWLDEVGRMKGELMVATRTADALGRQTERQAARLAEVMSRTADGKVAAARRWAAQEANKHKTLAYEEGLEWADMVSQIKAETADAREDLADSRVEKARLETKLADAALRHEREQRAAAKAHVETVVAARTEAEATAGARHGAATEAAEQRAERAEARLVSAAAEWSERLAGAEAREHEAVEQLKSRACHDASEQLKVDDRIAAEFKERIASAMARAEQAELARRTAEAHVLELESNWKEEELGRRVEREAALLEVAAAQGQLEDRNGLLKELSAQGQSLTLRAETAEADQVELRAELERMDAAMEAMTRRIEEQQQAQRAEVVGLLERVESSAQESETLGRVLSQRSAELAQLSAREALHYCVYRRTWVRMCCRLLTGSRSAVQLIFANQSTTDTDTESESGSSRTGFSPFRPRRGAALSPARPATLGRQTAQRASALIPVLPSDSGEDDDNEQDEAEAAGRTDLKSPELELEGLQDGEDQG